MTNTVRGGSMDSEFGCGHGFLSPGHLLGINKHNKHGVRIQHLALAHWFFTRLDPFRL